MRTVFIAVSVLSVIVAVVETICLLGEEINGITRASYKPYPLLGIVVLIDGFYFASMYDEMQTGTYLGKISNFKLTLVILIAVMCLMILLIIISALRSGIFGLGLAAVNTVVYLTAPIGIAWLLSTIVSAFVRVFSISLFSVIMFVVGIFVV